MFKTIVRITAMYMSSIIIMRVAGKKEVSQLQLSELVTSFMVSEIACMPITDPKLPLYKAIAYSTTVIGINMLVSYLDIKLPVFKHIVEGKPEFLIVKGKIDRNAMNRSQVTLSELVSAMRKEGVPAIDEINYAVLEPDGNISIITVEGEKESNGERGLQHMLITDGKINKSELELFGYDEDKLMKRLKKSGVFSPEEVFFFGIDDGGNDCLIRYSD